MAGNPGTVIKLRRDTASEWTTDNPVLEEGETGWETDTRRVKLGDGVTAWVDLPYAADEAADVTAETARAEAAETVLAQDITDETTRAETAETGLATAVDTETTRAIGIESGLDTRVGAIETTEATYGDIVTHDASEFVTDAELASAIATQHTTDIGVFAPKLGWVAECVDLWQYGNSYAAYTINSHTSYFDRLWQKLNSPVHGNWGVASTLAPDICSYMFGTWLARVQFAANLSSSQTLAAGTWTQNADPSLGTNGVVILECVRNDAGLDAVTTNSGTTAKSRAGFSNALDAMIRAIRAKSRVDNSSVSWTKTGAWTNSSGFTGCSGGTVSFTSTPGDKATITIGGDCDLILLGIDDAALGVTGSTFGVKIDGTPFHSGTISNQTRKTQFAVGTQGSTGGNYGFSQYAVPIRGLVAGNHTLELEHTGSAGHLLYLDCLLAPRDNTAYPPPTIIVPKNPEFGAAGYASYVALGGTNASRATDLIYNGLIDTVIAGFPNDGSVVTWDPMDHGFDATIHIGNKDGASVHLNDHGASFYASGLFDSVNALPARDGLVRT